jgi:hypothetical protein
MAPVPALHLACLMVIFSFFGLALTGMMLKFSYARWAQVLARLLGAPKRQAGFTGSARS